LTVVPLVLVPVAMINPNLWLNFHKILVNWVAAPLTCNPVGMVSSTSPYGRDVKTMGNPIKMTELVAQLPGTYFVTRQAVHSPNAVRKAKKAIRKAFENQKLEKGVSFVEIVSSCNSGWKMTPVKANKWMEENMFPFYPLGDIKVNGELVKKEESQKKQQP